VQLIPIRRLAIWRQTRTTWLRAAAVLAATGTTMAATAITATAAPADAVVAINPTVEVIVQLDRGIGTAQGAAIVERAGGRVTGRLPIINGLAAKLSLDEAGPLAAAGGGERHAELPRRAADARS